MSSPITTPQTPDPMARQNALLKRTVGLLLLALLAGAGGVLWVRHQGQPVAILLDGRQVATARNASAAEDILRAAERGRVGGAYPADSVVRLQKVQLVHLAGSTPTDTTDIARVKVQKALKLHVRCFAVYVNGRPALGLPTDDAATETLHRVKEHFAQMPPTTEILSEPEFLQRVAVREAGLEAAQTRPDPQSAAPYFWTPPPSRTVTVHRGDSGLVIARRHHLTLSEFIAANPGLDLNRMKPGTAVNVQKMPLLLNVQVTKRLTREEKIIAGAPESEAGRRSVTYVITYVNGEEIKRDVQSMSTLTPPLARRSL